MCEPNRDKPYATSETRLCKKRASAILSTESSLRHCTHGYYALTSIARGLARKRSLHVQRYGLR